MAKIFLIGMMGTGKSHWAEKWAKKTGTGHYDLDHLIELAEGESIAGIFAEKGEAYFRQLESDNLRRFATKQGFVLATGGGTPCSPGNMQWMNSNGITIWLDEPLEILVGRLKEGKAQRPLIRDLEDHELYAFLDKKLTERRPFYSQAQYRLGHKEISNKSLDIILNKEHANKY